LVLMQLVTQHHAQAAVLIIIKLSGRDPMEIVLQLYFLINKISK